jgi:hypothetical protein
MRKTYGMLYRQDWTDALKIVTFDATTNEKMTGYQW